MSYSGKCIYFDLSNHKFEIKESDKILQKEFIGGKGLGFALLDKIAPNPDPLGPDNPMIFVNGPFTCTKVQTSARTTMVTKSPLTCSIHDSHSGGYFGPALQRTGYDYIVITGKSKNPVYLYISDKEIKILDAANLWGKGIFDATDELMSRHKGIDPRVAVIGQAGENLSFMSCISVDKHRNFGRGGVGAVMGSKNLKAIVCDGSTPVKYADAEKFAEVNKKFTADILNNAGVKFRRQKGTMKCIRSGQAAEMLPVKNFQAITTDRWESVSSETAREKLNWEDTACFGCAIRCSKWARWDGHEIEGPEYETTAFLGTNCEIYNIKDVAWANEMCNDLGFDTISVGSTIGFAMECFEKGLVDDWHGIDMKWGNSEAQREFIKRMASRENIGDVFTDGSRIAAMKIGKGSEDFAINIYGMEISGINPKGALTFGVAMAVADFASHTRLWIAEQEFGPEFKIEDITNAVIEGIDTVNARNSLVICDFVPLNLDNLAEILSTVTGYEYTGKSLLKTGTKIAHLARRYNIRNGRTHFDDTLPGRFFNEESLAGFMRGKKLDRKTFSELVSKIYSARNWNEKGEPTQSILKEFNL
ncbi:MAG: aldehyde ferredoxin oxidoreductase family protein [Bacteroidota bacterium]